jgi:hypothetical protein
LLVVAIEGEEAPGKERKQEEEKEEEEEMGLGSEIRR